MKPRASASSPASISQSATPVRVGCVRGAGVSGALAVGRGRCLGRPLASAPMAHVQDAGRFGDRKVFIASLWTRMITIEAQTGGTLTERATIEHFRA